MAVATVAITSFAVSASAAVYEKPSTVPPRAAPTNSPADKATPFYVEGMLGLDRYESRWAFATDVGYQFSQYFSAETGAIFVGGGNWNLYLAGKMSVPVYDRFNVFAKFGLGYEHYYQNASGPMFGVGAAYNFTPKLYLEAQWLRFTGTLDHDIIDYHDHSVPSLLLAGVGYRFAL